MAMLAFEINKRQPLAEGRPFGVAGPYEQIDGTAHFGVDPAHPDNRDIADIALTPRDPSGLVRFTADVTILSPREPEHGNRRLLLDIPNRGNRPPMRFLNNTPPAVPGAPIDPGDGFLMRRGYTVAWCGWQHDVPDVAGLMRASVPEAQGCGGRADSRPAYAELPPQRAGTRHGSATWPLTDSNPLDGSRAQCSLNTVDYRPLLRAALVRLDRWVSAEEPSPSRYPRLADGTAVLPESTAAIFSGIPGMRFPAHLPRAGRNDFGPEANRGIATTLPPLPGKPYPCFVPAIDRDGNDVAGIRLPDLTVPLATHTGWNLRHPQIGASGLLLNLLGATVPFPATKVEREARGDPRPSIAERYPSREVYLERVRQAAQHLVEDRYLLAEDLELLVNQAAERFDVFARPSAGATPE